MNDRRRLIAIALLAVAAIVAVVLVSVLGSEPEQRNDTAPPEIGIAAPTVPVEPAVTSPVGEDPADPGDSTTVAEAATTATEEPTVAAGEPTGSTTPTEAVGTTDLPATAGAMADTTSAVAGTAPAGATQPAAGEDPAVAAAEPTGSIRPTEALGTTERPATTGAMADTTSAVAGTAPAGATQPVTAEGTTVAAAEPTGSTRPTETLGTTERPATAGAIADPAPAVAAPAGGTGSATTIAAAVSATTDEPGAAALAFDVLRIEADGVAVFAGRGTAGASIEVLLNGETTVTAEAGADGSWSAITALALEPGQYVAALRDTLPSGDTRESANPVMLLVPDRIGDTVAVEVEEEGVRVLQAPAPADQLTIDAISYGAGGHVQVAGNVPDGTRVELTVRKVDSGASMVTVLESTPDAGGRWAGTIEQLLPAGETYVLHARAGNAEAILRFRPEDPALVFRDGAVVVQPGNSLWRIARRVYGRGIRYHVIFRENNNQIDNPDLIFPGQVFTLPQLPN